MSDLVRFGVAMDRALLSDFDQRIAAQGYENRSEALRDLVRADLTRAAWDQNAVVAATLTVVYTPQGRDVVLQLIDPPSQHAPLVVSSLLVPLNARRCLHAIVLRGQATELSALAGQIGGAKGVLACELTLATVLTERASAHEP